ncbi:MAG: HAMP domain-containing histidine kinase [Paenibacillaceae bacterium]|nr:HAMP domain-containing histidine kinase [Paenibacillaceae bacterium]
MKSIKNKIQKPFLILLILIPLATLILFNLSFRIYSNATAKNELKTTIRAVEKEIKSELETDGGQPSEKKALIMARNILMALKSSHFSQGMDFYLLDRNAKPVFPSQIKLAPSQIAYLDVIKDQYLEMNQGTVYTIPVNGKKYFTIAYSLNNDDLSNLTAVFVLPADRMNKYLGAVNLILFAIMLLGILIAIYFSEKIAEHITVPITRLGVLSLQIGQGDFDVSHFTIPQDTLEFKQLYDNICIMVGRLETYDKNQKTFLQNASHELRTPLMSIQGYAEGIESGIFPDTKEAAQIIKRESIRLNELVSELLTLSRYESGTYKPQWEEVNLCHLLKDYTQRLMGLAAKSEKQLELLLPEYDVMIQTDDVILSQAVINIVSNCMRYARQKVTISLEKKGGIVSLIISDDGDGIPQNDIPFIFDRFYKGKNGNFGLGLAIAKSAAELLNGRIKAYNQEQGAVFEILF